MSENNISDEGGIDFTRNTIWKQLKRINLVPRCPGTWAEIKTAILLFRNKKLSIEEMHALAAWAGVYAPSLKAYYCVVV